MLNIAIVLCVILFVSVANGGDSIVTSMIMRQGIGNRMINNAMLESENKFSAAMLRAIDINNELGILLANFTATQESEMRDIITTAGDGVCGDVRNCSDNLYAELNATAANTLSTINLCGVEQIGWGIIYKHDVVEQKKEALKLMRALKEEFNKCPFEDSFGDFLINAGNCTFPLSHKSSY